MSFSITMGLMQFPELPEAEQDVLEEYAELFLRAGGSISIDEWAKMSPDERTAFVVAGDKLRLERVVKTGLASSSIEMAAKMSRPIDGGALEIEIQLEKAANRISNKYKAAWEK